MNQKETRVTVSRVRCPYCHGELGEERKTGCQECLAWHHAECWTEHGACSACGQQSNEPIGVLGQPVSNVQVPAPPHAIALQPLADVYDGERPCPWKGCKRDRLLPGPPGEAMFDYCEVHRQREVGWLQLGAGLLLSVLLSMGVGVGIVQLVPKVQRVSPEGAAALLVALIVVFCMAMVCAAVVIGTGWWRIGRARRLEREESPGRG